MLAHLFGDHYLQMGRAITFGFEKCLVGNSVIDLLRIIKGKDGKVKEFGISQRRYCDQNGKASADVDFKHADDLKTHFFPHLHIFEGINRGDPERVVIFEGKPIIENLLATDKLSAKTKGGDSHGQIGPRTFGDD